MSGISQKHVEKNQEPTFEDKLNWEFDTKEVISMLQYLLTYRPYKKLKPFPKFTGAEMILIQEFIFKKPEGWKIKAWFLPRTREGEEEHYEEIIQEVLDE